MVRLHAVVLAALAVVGGAAAQASSASGSASPFADIPVCSEAELVAAAELLTTDVRKLECQSVLGEAEMLKAADPRALCPVPACVAALKVLFGSLPHCRYKDWPVQYQCELLLENCGIAPVIVAQRPHAESFSRNSTAATEPPTAATSSDAPPSDNSSAFAPARVMASPSAADAH